MRRAALVLVVVVSAFAGLVLTGHFRSADVVVADPHPPPQSELVGPVALAAQGGVPAPLVAPGPDFTAIAAESVKAVTNISATQYAERPYSPFANDPFFRRFFGADDPFGGRSRRELSLGSGVIVSSDGYVLTNLHVIGGERPGAEVMVALADKREVRAEIVGFDDLTDIALLRLDLEGLPVIPWGDSSQLKVAEWVLAIGNPFQLSQTVTLGIVSALGRANIGAAAYEDFIQTDAAINPGNSGGALVNARGELIGINTAIYSRTGGYQGIGFAVPSNLARRVMDDLIKYGTVRRGSIGRMETIPVTTQVALELGLEETRGVLIGRMARGPAYDAGLRPLDVVMSFNGTRVDDPAQFLRLLADAPIGSTARLGIVRNGRALELKVPITPATQAGRRG
jgi:Do/DeqQ family serine protease